MRIINSMKDEECNKNVVNKEEENKNNQDINKKEYKPKPTKVRGVAFKLGLLRNKQKRRKN